MKKSLLLLILCIFLSAMLIGCSAEECDHSKTSVTREDKVAATCTEGGTYDEITSCVFCGLELERKSESVDPLSHELDVYAAKEPSCTEAGYNEYSACRRCDYTTYCELEPVGHSMVNYEAKAPTCTDSGYDEYSACSACDYTTYSEIAPLGHDEISHEAKAPTCTDIGYDAYVTCSVCDYTTYCELSALGHVEVIDERVEPTCSEVGFTEGAHCSVCDVVITERIEIAKLNHTYDSDKDLICNVCGSVRCEHIRMSHLPKEPTCEEDGYLAYVSCFKCGEILETKVIIPALGHNYVNHRCTVCDKREPAGDFSDMYDYYNMEDGTCYVTGFFGDAGTDITDIEIPTVSPEGYRVVGIYRQAFYGQSHITSVKIPDTIKEIGSMAFRDCKALKSIVIPDSVTKIGEYAFRGCKSLEEADIGDGIKTLADGMFASCENLSEVKLGSNIEAIGEYAFSLCSSLSAINIPDSVNEISVGAFGECSALVSIALPGGLLKIEDNLFFGCTSLSSIEIPDSVVSIGANAFCNCSSLGEIKIGKGTQSIGNLAFFGATALKNITVDSANSSFASKDGNLYSKDEKTLILYAVGKESKSFEIPSTVTTVADRAFNGAVHLTEITIPESVKSIGYGAFENCKSLEKVKIPDGVTELPGSLFASCESLIEVDIPASVKKIEEYAFSNCPALETVNYGGYDSEWKAVEKGYYGNDDLKNATVNCKHEHVSGTAVKENIVAATCQQNGSYDEVTRCSLCGDELSRVSIETPRADHSFSDGKCTVCGGDAELVRDGNYVYFGEYPQSIKKDDVTIDLNTRDSRGYYLGSDGFYYAAVTANPCAAGYTFTNNVMILSGTVYYFKVEPVRWRILTESDGNAFVLCDSIITSMPFDDYENGGSNSYKDSDVRAWLNSTLYETAFTEIQRDMILTTVVDNSPASTGDGSTLFACENTEDKLFLLSYAEMTSSKYGFSDQSIKDTARRIKTSDYARAMGAYMSTEYAYHGNGNWWLRSPWQTNGSTKFVFYDGSAKNNTQSYSRYMGVVPAMWVSLPS